jgi:hypothetical protein
MSPHPERDNAGENGDLPPGLKGPLIRLWRIERSIVVHILPRDAWVALGIIQFTTRNPALSIMHQQIIESFGRELQRALAAIDPSLDKYLELGWDPAFDQPRQERP